MPSILDAPDIEATIGSPFSDELFELSLNDRLREVWHRSTIATAQYDSETIDPPDEEHPDPDPKTAIWWLHAELGAVRTSRLRWDGKEFDVETTSVSLSVERYTDEEYSRIQVHCEPRADMPRRWNGALTESFHGIVAGLCDGSFPRPLPRVLRTALPENTAATLLREGHARAGADIFGGMVDEWWDRGLMLNTAALSKALASGDGTWSRWGVVREGETLHLLWPLLTEVTRIQLAHVPAPHWMATRYWLAFEIDGRGELVGLTIRSDRDATWDAEGDDDIRDDDGLGVPLRERLSEAGYGAFCDVVEFMRQSDD